MTRPHPWQRFAGVLSLIGLLNGCSDSGSPRDNDGENEEDASGSLDSDSGADGGLATDGGQDEESREPVQTEIGAPIGSPVGATIGAAGGTLVSPDGVLTVEIPAGALAADTAIGIQPITNLAPGGVGNGYELTPEGTTFALPVTLRFKYTKETIAGSAASFLGVAVQTAERYWELQWENAKLDETASTLSVETTHFSRWSEVTTVYIEPKFARLMTKGAAAFYVNHCVELPTKGPETWGPVSLLRCSKMSVTLAARTLSNWAVNGISGGNAALGTVTPNVENGYYTAPAQKPSPATVTLSVDARNPFRNGELAALTAEVEIIDGDRPYIGYMTFTMVAGGAYKLDADASITWLPTEDLGDVRHYRPTGTASIEMTLEGCLPAMATLTYPETGAGDLVIYTATNAAYPNQYQFTAAASGMVTLLCGDPPKALTMNVTAVGMGGACSGSPPLAPITNYDQLQGSGPCAVGSLSASEWSFVRDQSAD